MSAYVEMLPPDRPIHMLGQPIIKLVADGGPGGDLGDMGRRGWGRRRGRRRWPAPYYGPPPFMPQYPSLPPVQIMSIIPDSMPDASGSMPTVTDMALGQSPQFNTALQQELTAVAAGGAPDVSVEYFRPKDVPGLPSGYEGPHTGRQGVYPQKLRDMVVYDMNDDNRGSTAFVSLSDIARATPMENFGGSLGCCGADGMSDFGVPRFDMGNFGMPSFDLSDAPDVAKLLKGRCEGLEAKAREIVATVVKADGDASLTLAQKKAVSKAARKSLKALKGEWRLCRARLKEIIKHFKKQGNLKELGLSGLADAVNQEEKLAKCRARVRAIREIACKKKQKS